MTPADLRALLEQASPGEWWAGSVDTDCVFAPCVDAIANERVLARTNHHFPVHVADARVIAAAVNHLPALLALWEAAVERAAAQDEYFDATIGCEHIKEAEMRLDAAEDRLAGALQALEKAKVST